MKHDPTSHSDSFPTTPYAQALGRRRLHRLGAWLLVLLVGLAAACAGDTAEAPGDSQPATEADSEVTYEAAYPDEVSEEGLSEEDARQQAHSHDGESAHEHGDEGDHDHGDEGDHDHDEEAGHGHGEDGDHGEDDHSH